MRTTVILAAALMATACDTPDSQQADRAAADGAMTDGNMMADGQPGAMAAGDTMAGENVPTDAYVTRAAMSDMYEIEAGKLAVKNGESAETRRFGQMMVNDHTKSSEDMKSVLASAMPNVTPPARLDAEHQQMIDRLKAANGAAFDREYQTQQMMAHRKALALHEGYAANGDNTELKAFAQKVTPVIRKHHDQVNTMAGATGAAAAGANTGSTTGQANNRQGTTNQSGAAGTPPGQ